MIGAPAKKGSMMREARRIAVAATTLAIGLGLGGPLRAQPTPVEERCKAIMSIISGVIIEYRGQVSTDLISDLQRKVGEHGRCDGPDEYRVWPNTKDREVLGRIRGMISAWDTCRKDPTREGCEAASGQ
jgi:hypothetical protein